MESTAKYKNAQELGKVAEKMAADYYINNGYKLEKMNFKSRTGEIDVIVSKGNELVFVEVKARSEKTIARPCEFVTKAKQKKILKTALIYLKYIGSEDFFIRFDVVEAENINGKISLNCIENAFDASLIYNR